MAKEEVSKLGRGDGFVGAQKEGLLGQHVNKGGDGVVGVTIRGLGLGQVSDQVEGDMGPGMKRDGMGLKETRCGLGRGFDALTGSTRGDVGAYSASYVRPPEVSSHSIEGLDVTRVSSSRGVMELVEKASAEVRFGRDADAGVEVPAAIWLKCEVRWVLGIRCVVGVRGVRSLDVIGEGISESDMGR